MADVTSRDEAFAALRDLAIVPTAANDGALLKQLSAIRIRSENVVLPVALFPGVEFDVVWRVDETPVEAPFCDLATDEHYLNPATRLRFWHPSRVMQLTLPHIQRHSVSNHDFIVEFRSEKSAAATVAAWPSHGDPVVAVRPGEHAQTIQVSSFPYSSAFHGEVDVETAMSASDNLYRVRIRIEAREAMLAIRATDGVVEVELTTPVPTFVRVSFSAGKLWSRPQLSGNPTVGLLSELVLVTYDQTVYSSPALPMNLTTAVLARLDVPLSPGASSKPNRTYKQIFSDAELPLSSLQSRPNLFSISDCYVRFGKTSEDQFRRLIEWHRDKYLAMFLLPEEENFAELLAVLSKREGTITSEGPFHVFRVDRITVALAHAPPQMVTQRFLELLRDLIHQTSQQSLDPDLSREIVRMQRAGRQYSGRPLDDILIHFENIMRGATVPYPDVQVVQRDAQVPSSPADLDSALSLVASWLAQVAIVDTYGREWPNLAAPSDGASDADRRFLESEFRAWQTRRTVGEPTRAFEDRRDTLLARLPIERPVLHSRFTEIAREVLTSHRTERGLHSFVNPLVICVFPERRLLDPAWLLREAAHLTLAAASLAGSKPSAMIPLIVSEQLEQEIRAASRQLRLSIAGGPENFAAISAARQEVSRLLGQVLPPNVMAAVRTFAPDRIWAVSDIALDLTPCGQSLLGDEFTLARVPITPSAVGYIRASAFANIGLMFAHQRSLDIAVIHPRNMDDPASKIAVATAINVAKALEHHFGRHIQYPEPGGQTPVELLQQASACQTVIFVGHAFASSHEGGLIIDESRNYVVTTDDIRKVDWKGKIVVLIGCETGAGDTVGGNIAHAFFDRGATAVIGTSAKVRVDIATVFLVMFVESATGMQVPIDHAFFGARRAAIRLECAAGPVHQVNWAELDLAQMITAAVLGGRSGASWTQELARELGWDVQRVLDAAWAARSFSLLGGVGQRVIS